VYRLDFNGSIYLMEFLPQSETPLALEGVDSFNALLPSFYSAFPLFVFPLITLVVVSYTLSSKALFIF